MLLFKTQSKPFRAKTAFTLVELLVVIAIISILMTAGSIGLSGLGGKGVTSGVTNAEALFNEARSIAVGKSTTARVLVAMDLTNNPTENLRRILTVYSEINPSTGREYDPKKWVLATRATVLPDQTYFSKTYSMYDHGQKLGFGATSEMTLSAPTFKTSYVGKYLFYEFNSQGICNSPGASFIIGTGTRAANQATSKPRITSSAKRDFGGFVVWRNGGTSVFRGPDQIGVGALSPGDTF